MDRDMLRFLLWRRVYCLMIVRPQFFLPESMDLCVLCIWGGKMIIGLCGTIGAGKSTTARYYSQCCGFERLSFGDEVRREATARGLSHDRGVLQKLGARLRQEEGIHVWVDCIFSQ